MLKKVLSVLSPITTLVFVVFIAVNSSQIHTKIIRATVEDKIGYVIVPISGRDMQGRVTEGPRSLGTGFDVKLPSGKNAILTNRHVCKPSKNGFVYIIKDNDNIQHQRKIITVSETSDLCLVEPVKEDGKGLSVASGLSTGDHVIAVGHPAGLPLMPAYGEAVSMQTIPVLSDMYDKPILNEKDKAKATAFMKESCKHQNQQVSFQKASFFGIDFEVGMCIDFNVSVLTTCQILGGSSGSPLFNNWGNVVGVMFAGSQEHNNWGYAIPLESIKEFLNGR